MRENGNYILGPFKHRKYRWDYVFVAPGSNEALLHKDWEPFTAVPSDDQFATFPYLIGLKKRVEDV